MMKKIILIFLFLLITFSIVYSQENCHGCLYNNECYQYGSELEIDNTQSYCDISGNFKPKKQDNEVCDNDFECINNLCSYGKCVDLFKQLEEAQELTKKIIEKEAELENITRPIEKENLKKIDKYSNEGVFLISDKDWKDVLSLVPVTTWTDKEGKIHKYPTLIYHEEENGFDADSIIYFMQQYLPNRVTIIGQTPQELNDLITKKEIEYGAQLGEEKVQNININDLLGYWKEYKDVVYVKHNYQLALLASTYASLINAPLIIQNSALDDASDCGQNNCGEKGDEPCSCVFDLRNVFLIGDVDCPETAASCDEAFKDVSISTVLENLQKEYIKKTDTDKIILVNPEDLDDVYLNENFQPERSGNPIRETFGGISLAAPLLASSKHELILTFSSEGISPTYTTQTDLLDKFNKVDAFLETKFNALLRPKYLTIMASHLAIPDSSASSYSSGYRDNLDWKYASSDNQNINSEINLGRILGITISDVSAYIARSVFYDELFGNIYSQDKFNVLSIGHSRPHYARDSEKVLDIASELEYAGKCYMDVSSEICLQGSVAPVKDYSKKQIITFADHGGPQGWSGTIYTSNLPLLDLSFAISKACSPNNLWKGKGRTFGLSLLRKGAIAYSGGSGLTPSLPGVCSEDQIIKCWTDSACTGKGICIPVLLPGSGALKYISENNEISLGELFIKLAQDNWLSKENGFRYYKKHLYLGDPTLIPKWA